MTRRAPKRPRAPREPGFDEALFRERKTKSVPFDFVLEALEGLDVTTRPMFGCTAVYVGEKIVLILRDRPGAPNDNGVWIATTQDRHEALRKALPSMRSIEIFADGGPTGWQVLPADDDAFEEQVLRACELVRAGDPRIGNIPKAKTRRPAAKKTAPMKSTPKTAPMKSTSKTAPMKAAPKRDRQSRA